MIQVTIERTNMNRIHSFTISGHAHFANHGEDIVCAGVSAVSFGMINAIMQLTKVKLDIDQGDNGFLRCTVPEQLSGEVDEKVQLLLQGMVVSLQTIERDYNKYVHIKFVS